MKLKEKKSLVILLLFSPLFANYLYNFFIVDKLYVNIQVEKLLGYLLSVFFSIFLYQIGIKIKKYLNLSYVGTGIVIFLTSFFIFDKTFLFLLKNISSNISFFIVISLWLIFFIYKNYKDIYPLTLYYLIFFLSQRILTNYFKLSESEFLTSDEKYFWLPVSRNIYEFNLYEALLNNPLPSYGLMVGHVHATLNRFFSYSESFLYYPAYKNVLFFLTVYFIFELDANKASKVIGSLIFLVIVLTSDWFTYLFFNSLLAESISSYFFGLLFLEIFKNKNNIQNIVFFSLGFLYFSKQFISLFAILIGVYAVVKFNKNVKIYFLIFTGIIIDFLNSLFLKTPITWRMYTDSFRSDATTGEGGINFQNIINIIQQFLIDRPMSYFIFIVFMIFLYLFFQSGIYDKDLLLLILTNTILVFLLYIFVWTNVEYESSYRYLLNIFHIILVFFISTLNIFLNLDKK